MVQNCKGAFMNIVRFVLVFLLLLLSDVSAQEMDQQFEGFNLEGYTDEGEKSWDVNGSTADVMGSRIQLTDVNANAYGDQKMNVKADTGMVDQTSGEMELHDDVIITTEEGTQLMTDSLYWDREDDLVTSEDDVLITDQGLTVSGVGLEAQPGLKRSQINQNVRALVDMDRIDERDGSGYQPEKPRRPLTITSDGPMVIDQSKNLATFEENVIAVQDDQTLKADRMEIYMTDDMNDITEIVCIGNVEIEQGENKTYADRATFNRLTQKLTLSGRPKLILLTEGEGGITSFRN